jgi:hypothetical protein
VLEPINPAPPVTTIFIQLNKYGFAAVTYIFDESHQLITKKRN